MNWKRKHYSEPKPGMKIQLIEDMNYGHVPGNPRLKKGSILTLLRTNTYNNRLWYTEEIKYMSIPESNFELI